MDNKTFLKSPPFLVPLLLFAIGFAFGMNCVEDSLAGDVVSAVIAWVLCAFCMFMSAKKAVLHDGI